MKERKEVRVGVLLGGRSAEREVSLRSGAAVRKALISLGYNAVAIDAAGDFCSALRRRKIDVAFIALHGGYGENGAVQGMLEILGIPYTGSGVLASALAMDKEASKVFFHCHGVPVPPFAVVRRDSLKSVGQKKVLRSGSTRRGLGIGFGLPWVIKPATEGSSVGVEIVKEEARVTDALENAFAYGDRAIIEQFIKGKEVQIGILRDRPIGGVEVRPKLEFYSYEAKYTQGLTEYILPPELKKTVYERAKAVALSAHRALGCRGATRVDLIIDDSGTPYVLEVNTIPGMTETSLLPKIADHAGLDFPRLIEEILKDVLRAD